jgi:hypothetical protein
MPLNATSVLISGAITAVGIFATVAPRKNRTAPMALVAGVLVTLIWLVTWETPTGLPPLARGGLAIACMVTWYVVLVWGTRLGLCALSSAEHAVNEAVNAVSQRAWTSGSAVDLVQRPPELEALLRELDGLDPPNERWDRVLRLTREFLLQLPIHRPVPPDSMLEYQMWRVVWFDAYERRVLFAKHLDPAMEFRADLHLDRSAVLRALAERQLVDASGLVERLAARTAPVDRWREVQRLLVEALRARAASVEAGRDPERDATVLAADAEFREAWRAAADTAGP